MASWLPQQRTQREMGLERRRFPAATAAADAGSNDAQSTHAKFSVSTAAVFATACTTECAGHAPAWDRESLDEDGRLFRADASLSKLLCGT